MTYFDLWFILFTDLFWQSGFFKVYYEKTWQRDKSDNRSANTTEMASLRAVYEIKIITFLVFYVQSYYLYALKSVNIFLDYFIYCF